MSLFLRHAEELARRAEHTPQWTSFLTPAEQREIFDSLTAFRRQTVFWGGVEGAERRRAVFLPDWLYDAAQGMLMLPEGISAAGEGPFSPAREALAREAVRLDADLGSQFAAVAVAPSGFVQLSHRDYLGAVMRLGLERETVGEIILTPSEGAVIVCTPNAAACIAAELSRVGRDTVRCSLCESIPRISRQFEDGSVVISSMRLDCVVKALCNVSRDGAQRLISAGDCDQNYKTAAQSSAAVAAGDIISVRGHGKFVIGEVTGTTKKDRLRLAVRKYV